MVKWKQENQLPLVDNFSSFPFMGEGKYIKEALQMKKLVSLVLALLMVFSITASLAEIVPTTEEITLTYADCGEDLELTMALADQFMKQYPNIKVEIIDLAPGFLNTGYDTAIGNLASTQDLPDVFWVTRVTDAVGNEWCINLDKYYAEDPDAALIHDSILDANLIAGKRYSVPAQSRPYMMLINKTLFDQYNVPMPEYTWSWEEFKDLALELNHPEDMVTGYGNATTCDAFIPMYGWDGESYTVGDLYIETEEMFAEWRLTRVSDGFVGPEKEALFGDPNVQLFNVGHACMNAGDLLWGGTQYIDGTLAAELGCEFEVYPVPTPHEAAMDNMFFACIAASCEHPDEAWLLAKWMTWGKEATMLRNQWFHDEEVLQISLPMIDDAEVKQHAIDCADPALKNFFMYSKPTMPMAAPHAPGFQDCNVQYFNVENLQNRFAAGEVSPSDVADSLREKFNFFRDRWFAQNPEVAPEGFTGAVTPTDLATGTDAQ
ncbi:MAG: extracellular solute-binding protein [Clostridiales bacterium]|nr:extracellular solute-binding protein [Clostridiales bacterium]